MYQRVNFGICIRGSQGHLLEEVRLDLKGQVGWVECGVQAFQIQEGLGRPVRSISHAKAVASGGKCVRGWGSACIVTAYLLQ